MGEYTKGPWRLNEFSESVEIEVTPHIVSVGYMGTLANARLAAASPDMYEALERCISVMERHITPKPDVGPDHPYSILKQAKSALNKATKGESND